MDPAAFSLEDEILQADNPSGARRVVYCTKCLTPTPTAFAKPSAEVRPLEPTMRTWGFSDLRAMTSEGPSMIGIAIPLGQIELE